MSGSGHQRRASYRLLLMVLWATLLAFAIELSVGWVSHSLCLLAESLHTLIDVFSALLGLVAVASPQRTLGKEIWGYGRGEASGALVLSAVLGFAGISIVTIAFSQLDGAFFETTRGAFQVAVTGPLLILVGVMAGLVMVAAGLAFHQSRHIYSLALKLTAQHIVTDAWLTGLVLIGLMAIRRGYQWIDPMLSIFLTVMAVRSLWQVLHQQLPMLLKPTAIAPEAIAQIACQVEGVIRCTRILSRGMVGRQVWIELHLVLHPEFMVIAHTIGEQVERSLRARYGPIRARIFMAHHQPSDPIGPKYRTK